jgi:polar amino acid transport system substrate-binding protein
MRLLQAMRLTAIAALLAAAGPVAAQAPPVLRVVAATNQSMPLLGMAGQVPVDGLIKELGELLARRLGMTPVFVALPSKRVGPALASGAADLLCYVKAEWLDEELLWTQPFLPGAGVIAATPQAPAVAALQDLRDETLGTVLGYKYPVIEQALKQPMRREDVPDALVNLRRLALGRVRYAVTDRAVLAYFMRLHPEAGLREAIDVEHYQLGCALTPHKPGLLVPLRKVIGQMQTDGSLEALQARYR